MNESEDDEDGVHSDDGHVQMHKAFAGKENEEDEDGDKDYMAKLDKNERKKFKKNQKKDKIGTRDARVLTGARTVADHASMS